ncbi:MAG: Gfo/Idh/MocA family oxidoreductase [Candidatus Gastranaerophilales bacterium]|nr:Gfo/Idh/MocA family oxidoreductase [Candidatus Gastranaerophilales bacterium]
MHNIAVIGCGLWGRNIVRNFYNLNALNTVCDLDPDNIAKVREQYPEVNTTNNFQDVFNNPEIQGVIVVTPSHTHYKIVKAALEAGKNVYVEKPISTVAEEARKLTELADSKGLVLMVGHLLLYHPAVNRLRMLIKEGALGKIRYIQSDRLNINHFKNDRSVMWDLAPHDVSMTSYIIDKEPLRVISAVGASSDGNEIMDITHVTIEYEDGIIGHISDSWIHPQKRVNLLVRGTKASAMFDDTLPEHKLQIFDNSAPGAVKTETLDYLEIEPLKLECQHFLNCIEQGKKARSDGENGFNVTKVLEEAEKIMLGERRKNLDEFDFALSRSKR